MIISLGQLDSCWIYGRIEYTDGIFRLYEFSGMWLYLNEVGTSSREHSVHHHLMLPSERISMVRARATHLNLEPDMSRLQVSIVSKEFDVLI